MFPVPERNNPVAGILNGSKHAISGNFPGLLFPVSNRLILPNEKGLLFVIPDKAKALASPKNGQSKNQFFLSELWLRKP